MDFDKIDFINSGGIKLWVHFAENLESYQNLSVHFHNCPRSVVDQVNLVQGFLPKNASVESVYVPIYCTKCEETRNVHLMVSDPHEKFEQIGDDEAAGPDCEHDFEVEIIKDRYFRFLKDM